MTQSTAALKFEGVVVGLVELDDDQTLLFKIKASSTETYLKELLACNFLSSISLDIDPTEDFQPNQFDRSSVRSL